MESYGRGDVSTQGFPFQSTLTFPSSLPVAYVNQPKALIAADSYYSYVFITTSIRAKK